MRFLAGIGWMAGGVLVATAGMVVGAFTWRYGIGPVLAFLAVAGGIAMVDRGMQAW
jgi:hypothetical protein